MSDLSVTPDSVLEEIPTFNTLVSQFENGVEQRRAKRSSAIREFKLIFKNRTASDFTTIVTFYTGKYGAYTSFTWTNPNDSVEYTVRFKDDSFRTTRRAYQVYDYEFSLIQVL